MDTMIAPVPSLLQSHPAIQSSNMKYSFFPSLAVMAVLVASGHARTLNWGSVVDSKLVDSHGVTLDGTFDFELGAFAAAPLGWVPSVGNTSEWFSYWKIFDRAGYSAADGYFTSKVLINADGTSNSSVADAGSFAGLDAYLWIHDDALPTLGGEWLLARDPSWTFPAASPGCCDNALPIEWSVSDLGLDDTPVFGTQGGVSGPGSRTYEGPSTLQTHTLSPTGGEGLLPEPSSALLVLGLGVLALLDRRRGWIG
jgi:hypothetical protein